MALSETRPDTLGAIVGQPGLNDVHDWKRAGERNGCFLFIGSGGTGKTSAALALANELGTEDVTVLDAATVFSGDDPRQQTLDFLRRLRHRSLFGGGSGWRVFILEEFQTVKSANVVNLLKTGLERANLPNNVLVIATSNGTQIEPALLQRFHVVEFDSSEEFGDTIYQHVSAIWKAKPELGALPVEALQWGKTESGWSMRVALDQCERAMRRKQRPGQPTAQPVSMKRRLRNCAENVQTAGKQLAFRLLESALAKIG